MAMELLRPSQVCKMLSVSRTWLYEATRQGRVPSVRLGEDGPVRYDRTELEAWLRRRGGQALRRQAEPGRSA